ncbi:replication-relaxation family protein [Streptomyces sp. NPDC017991]|uniref:replication-relaxation family protein n=1 Tax=Streptomyces sp. NPDC017991 TaxID=3365026 RepID=UPI0037AD418D
MALPSAGRNRATVQTDAVLHAPEAGVPVLLFEVDNCTESADVLVAKFDRYRRFFRQKTKDHQGRELPVWRTLYPPTFREGFPPVAVVFNPGIRTGEQALKNRMNRVLDLTREFWSGSWQLAAGSWELGAYERPVGGSGRRVPRLRRRDPAAVHDPALPPGRGAARAGVVAVRPPPVGDPHRCPRQRRRHRGLAPP